jgi:ABC-2 type transport system ATP-binding protein
MQNESENIINVEHINKTFTSIRGFWKREKHPVQAVKDISFAVHRGELFGMVGPNGAGKTTTVKMLATLLLPTGGKATIFGHDVVKDTYQIRPRIGFTFGGNKGLYSRLSALDNLRYFAELYKLDPETIEKRIKEMLDVVGLTGRRKTGRNVLQRYAAAAPSRTRHAA